MPDAPFTPPVPRVIIVLKNAAKVKSMPAVTAIWPSRLNQPTIRQTKKHLKGEPAR